jgi:hypothetical protein
MAASFPGSVKSFGIDRVDGDYIPADDVNTVRAEIVAMETALLAGGWISDVNIWTYVSASSFTVPGNQTAIFTKGLRLKWTQTIIKYGVSLSSVYASGTGLTTVNIAVNGDYTVTNAAISANSYSNLDEPRGWPGWFNYSPFASGVPSDYGFSVLPTLGNSVYNIRGRACFVTHKENANGTSNSTAFVQSLPVVAALGSDFAVAAAYNGGVYVANVQGTFAGGATAIAFQLGGSSTGWTATGGKRVSFQLVYSI